LTPSSSDQRIGPHCSVEGVRYGLPHHADSHRALLCLLWRGWWQAEWVRFAPAQVDKPHAPRDCTGVWPPMQSENESIPSAASLQAGYPYRSRASLLPGMLCTCTTLDPTFCSEQATRPHNRSSCVLPWYVRKRKFLDLPLLARRAIGECQLSHTNCHFLTALFVNRSHSFGMTTPQCWRDGSSSIPNGRTDDIAER